MSPGKQEAPGRGLAPGEGPALQAGGQPGLATPENSLPAAPPQGPQTTGRSPVHPAAPDGPPPKGRAFAGQGGRRGRRALGLQAQISMGFGLFALVVLGLLWVLQTFLLTPFYRATKTAEAKSIAASVVKGLGSEGLDQLAYSLCVKAGVNIFVTDPMGRQHVAYRQTFKDSLAADMGQLERIALFDKVNLQGGAYTQTFFSRSSGMQLLLYGVTSRTGDGGHRLVLVESEITPVDATVDTLQIQLLCVTVVMLLLGAGLAWYLARRIARPLAAMNNAAKLLGSGDYNIRFASQGAREVSELAHTLNYAAEELSKVEELRRELLANVSHDLRTPLTMIKGYAEVMRDLPGENTPENVQVIIDETERLNQLVNDLLDLSRMEAGAMQLEKSPFNLTEAIRAALGRYDKLAGFSFPFQYEGEAYVEADALKISQVLYNLVNNAINYAGEDKTVSLRQEVAGGRVRISVTDTGEGIPPDKLRDIWERYYKVDREHRRAQVGTGLGLSIVRKILDLHGGAYGVESALGQGSTFWFELPSTPPGP